MSTPALPLDGNASCPGDGVAPQQADRPASNACFTYGSLMVAEIMARVCGCAPTALHGQQAWLDGYARHPVIGQDYPGMRPCPGDTVPGLLYPDLDEAMLARLDTFEGEEYRRQLVTVRLADGSPLQAWTYCYKPEYAARLAPGAWSFETFLASGRARFEAGYLGFEHCPPPGDG